MRITHEGGTIWTPQNENNAERRGSIHSQTNIFLCKRRYAISWKYIDIQIGAVRQFQLVNNYLKLGL
jgi:hypothetical protein